MINQGVIKLDGVAPLIADPSDVTPLIDIHPFSNIAVTLEPNIQSDITPKPLKLGT